jgi:RNA polymerase sigma-70 factor (ECF subfamily)
MLSSYQVVLWKQESFVVLRPLQIEFFRILLERLQPSPVIALNRAVAIAMVDGPRAALAIIDALAEASDLDNYHLLHAARADLLRRIGSSEEAAKSYKRALTLATNDSERRYLDRRLGEVQASSG